MSNNSTHHALRITFKLLTMVLRPQVIWLLTGYPKSSSATLCFFHCITDTQMFLFIKYAQLLSQDLDKILPCAKNALPQSRSNQGWFSLSFYLNVASTERSVLQFRKSPLLCLFLIAATCFTFHKALLSPQYIAVYAFVG